MLSSRNLPTFWRNVQMCRPWSYRRQILRNLVNVYARLHCFTSQKKVLFCWLSIFTRENLSPLLCAESNTLFLVFDVLLVYVHSSLLKQLCKLCCIAHPAKRFLKSRTERFVITCRQCFTVLLCCLLSVRANWFRCQMWEVSDISLCSSSRRQYILYAQICVEDRRWM